MKSKSEKYRELLDEEKYLQSQLDVCKSAQSKMLKKAFKNLGLKFGSFGELVNDPSQIKVIAVSGCAVTYCRYTGAQVEDCEISFEDLFDVEVQESEATACKFCGSNESDRRMNSIVCSGCGRKIGNVAPPEVQE